MTLPRIPVDEPFRMSDESGMVGEGQRRKSAPTGVAAPDGRGLADRKDNDRLMATLPRPDDTTPPCSLAHVDGCPDCVTNTEAPEHVEPSPRGCVCFYRCHDCGYVWQTAWGCS